MRAALTLEACWHRVPGGTAVAAVAVAGELAALGIDVVGVAARHGAPPAEFVRPPVPVHHLPLPRPLLYDAWHTLRCPRVERATGPVDVIHATALVVPPRTAPLVVTVHDLAFRHDHAHRRGRRVAERGLALARRDADLVLCSSRATLVECEAAGIDPARLRHVPLGVAPQPLASDDDVAAVRVRYGLPERYLLFTGTLEPRKNLPRLLAAFRSIADEVGGPLVLVGPTGWGPDLAPTATGLPLRPLGMVPGADLRALYRGAAVCCYPSLREGFGLPILEAMAQGTPVVTSRGTSTEEVAGGAAVLVDPLDPADIARGILEAVADADRLGVLGRARAAAATWAATAQCTLAAYREVAGR